MIRVPFRIQHLICWHRHMLDAGHEGSPYAAASRLRASPVTPWHPRKASNRAWDRDLQ